MRGREYRKGESTEAEDNIEEENTEAEKNIEEEENIEEEITETKKNIEEKENTEAGENTEAEENTEAGENIKADRRQSRTVSKIREVNILEIRQEQPADYDAVYQTIKEAFAHAEHSDGNEQDLVSALRESEAFIPELSLVAVEDNRIVGHILFTEATVNNMKVLALAPLSVLPAYQNRGIGLALIRQGHAEAVRLGYSYAVVLGHAEYYPKAGYVPASRYGIRAPFPVEDDNFMAVCLSGNAERLNGTMEYGKAFGI